jgi:hypothetical protein
VFALAQIVPNGTEHFKSLVAINCRFCGGIKPATLMVDYHLNCHGNGVPIVDQSFYQQ